MANLMGYMYMRYLVERLTHGKAEVVQNKGLTATDVKSHMLKTGQTPTERQSTAISSAWPGVRSDLLDVVREVVIDTPLVLARWGTWAFGAPPLPLCGLLELRLLSLVEVLRV